MYLMSCYLLLRLYIKLPYDVARLDFMLYLTNFCIAIIPNFTFYYAISLHISRLMVVWL